MGIPDTMIQQVLGGNQSLQQGNISQLGGLNSLYGGTQYQGLQDTMGANLSQPTATMFSPGGAGAYPGGAGGSRYGGLYPNTAGTGTFGTGYQPSINPYNGLPMTGATGTTAAPQFNGYGAGTNQPWTQNSDGTWTNNQTGAVGTFDNTGQFQPTTNIIGQWGNNLLSMLYPGANPSQANVDSESGVLPVPAGGGTDTTGIM
jgi:hypothetical protein